MQKKQTGLQHRLCTMAAQMPTRKRLATAHSPKRYIQLYIEKLSDNDAKRNFSTYLGSGNILINLQFF
jgi:hypothetical protein